MKATINGKEVALRVRIEEDYDADLSYLSETEEEYKENGPLMAPTCAHCFGEIETKYTNTRTSPNHSITVHKATGRIRCGWNNGRGFNHQAGIYAIAERRELTWEEYRESYGDPNRYQSYGVIVEEWNPAVGAGWEVVTSVWGCDLYEEWADTGSFDTLEDIENDYTREMAQEELENAVWMLEQQAK